MYLPTLHGANELYAINRMFAYDAELAVYSLSGQMLRDYSFTK